MDVCMFSIPLKLLFSPNITSQAAQIELLQSSSQSGFIARQVAAHVDRLRMLTLPELRVEAKLRGLTHTGKKKSVLARLSVWVRDEVSNSVGNDDADDNVAQEEDPSQKANEEDSDASSDEELAFISGGEINADSEEESDSSEDELEISGQDDSKLSPKGSKPVPKDNASLTSKAKSPLHASMYDIFGYQDFREGQEWAIRRCLAQKKTLLVAPTGQGKSLCYALPAALMDGVCIVVSPLVSLMEVRVFQSSRPQHGYYYLLSLTPHVVQDQLRHLPPSIPAATLSGNMTTKKMATIIDDLIRNRLKILFMSPERLASAAFRRLLRPKYNLETKTYERQLPKVSLLCVDEAHCLSQVRMNTNYTLIFAIAY